MITNAIQKNNNAILNFFSSLWYTTNNFFKIPLDLTRKVTDLGYLLISQHRRGNWLVSNLRGEIVNYPKGPKHKGRKVLHSQHPLPLLYPKKMQNNKISISWLTLNKSSPLAHEELFSIVLSL